MIIFFFVVFGLLVGSFLNVAVLRLASGEGGIVAGHSHCVSCDHDLAWYDNIPVLSYLLLRGKCRYCSDAISAQYPCVEMMTATVFGVVGAVATRHADLSVGVVFGILSAALFASMIVIFVYDLKYMEVPMIAIYIGVGLAVLMMFMRDKVLISGLDLHSLWQSATFLHIVAGVVCFGFFFGLSFVSDETWMGYGDGFIALVIGLFLGPMASFVAIMIAVFSGALIGSFMMLAQGKTLKTAIPFGPYLVGGMFIAYVLLHFYPTTMSVLW